MGKSYSKEQIEDAKNISILDYAQRNGFHCKKVGNEIHITGFGGLYVNSNTNAFYNFSAAKGGYGCVEFVKQYEGLDFKEAMKTLVGEPTENYQKTDSLYIRYVPNNDHVDRDFGKERPTEFTPPDKSEDYKNAYAYLIKKRGLAKELINDFVKKGILYQTTSTYTDKDGKTYVNKNIVFLHRDDDGKPCGASLQGTMSDRRFKQNMLGTADDFGYVYNKGFNPQTVYLFEAPIDMMSFVQLHPEIENAKFVAMEGLKPSIAGHYINLGYNVISCVDNDNTGKTFNNNILCELMQKALGGHCAELTVDDSDPPIEYLEAEYDGNKITLFPSGDDYKNFKDYRETTGKCFIWKNESNFQLNDELAHHNVKDFNDLLKKLN